MKNILYINNGSGLSDVQSGGAARHIETARILGKSCKIYCVTALGGLGNYRNNGLKFNGEFVVASHIWKKRESSNLDRLVSYFISTLHSLYLVVFRKLPRADVVYSTSDYFCDVIPAVFYKIIYGAKYVSMVHHRTKSPFKRSGNFLFNFLSFLFQRVGFRVVHYFSDALLVYDTPEGQSIVGVISPRKHYFVKNGINMSAIEAAVPKKDWFEASFAGGLRETKGIFDLVQIWVSVVAKHPSWCVAVAGGGTVEVTNQLKGKIKQVGLTNNIILLGPLQPRNLYRLIKSSAVFISASHEEGWGISVLEAVALGTPVVAYKLPAFSYLGAMIIRVPLFDHTRMADEIIRVVEDKELHKTLSEKGMNFAR